MKPSRTSQVKRFNLSLAGVLLIGVLGSSFLTSGCRLLRKTASVPQRTAQVFIPGTKTPAPEPGELQSKIMRFSDEYSALTVQSLNEVAHRMGTPDAPREALEHKLNSVSAAIAIASGPNPYANLLDMIGMVTLTRIVLEDYWMHQTNGPALAPWLSASRQMETNIWGIADEVLPEDKLSELKTAIEEWYDAHRDIRSTFLSRPRSFSTTIRAEAAAHKDTGAVFDLLNLDPMAGLDPAVREVTESRLFAERALYSLQRAPELLRWQTELLAYDLTAQPTIEMVVTNMTSLSHSIDRASLAAKSISDTAAGLPDQLSAERQAIMTSLEEQEGKLTALAVEVRGAVEAADGMGTSLSSAITNMNALMKRFGVGEHPTNAEPKNPNAKPFDVLDFAETANQVAAMAQELNAVIDNLNSTLDGPGMDAVDQISEKTVTNIRSLLFQAVLLLAGLVVFIFVCAGIYRRMGRSRA